MFNILTMRGFGHAKPELLLFRHFGSWTLELVTLSQSLEILHIPGPSKSVTLPVPQNLFRHFARSLGHLAIPSRARKRREIDMARMNLSGLTPEEKKARKARQADDRKKKQRAKEKAEREMAKMKNVLTPASPEVVEFLALVEGFKIAALTEAVGAWERDYKQPLPVAPLPTGVSPFGPEGMRHRDLELAKMLACDFYPRRNAAERKKARGRKRLSEKMAA
ncbi:hypothetical protein FY136_02570 [Agrobacterium tumefaciens]|uniref:hypothetical protein n=1 Tax=Agrobacterium tumefaciens TaxID=358 RepID=UPI0021CE61BF|nr:hypothetical protein [Agrobacterium tumefaciens]UXT48170.1 hypothetical protein FY136_02570 [Agrobacterium tumefaciens]